MRVTVYNMYVKGEWMYVTVKLFVRTVCIR